jgi:hypothetical protein
MSMKIINEKKTPLREKVSLRDPEVSEGLVEDLTKIKITLPNSSETEVTRPQEIPTSIDPTINVFTTLRNVARLIERHYDSYTDAEEKKLSSKAIATFTELNVSGLTDKLNDVEKSQAAMLIRQIINDHPLLKKIILQNNNFAAPDLQFIINSLMYVKYEPVKKYNMIEVNLEQAVTTANLERSGDILIQLKKAYGKNISFDPSVYDHFIAQYLYSCNHYSLYLAKKIILPKANVEPEGSDEEILTAAEKVIKQGLPAGTKHVIRFESAAKKFLAMRELTGILTSNASTQEKFDNFQTQYKTHKKNLAKFINNDDEAHLDRLYERIGDVKPKIFTASNNPAAPIFKQEPKKKKKRRKTAKRKKKPAAKKKAAKAKTTSTS